MTRAEEIRKQIKDLCQILDQIMAECSHPKDVVVSENKSNTGNYDPSSDRYWTDHHCTFCDKRWRTDQ